MTTDSPIAVVTGVASGIGRAVRQRFIADGWQVVGLDIATPDDPVAFSELIHADLSMPDDTNKAITALAGHDPIAFVHAAGVMCADTHAATQADAGAALWMLHVGAAHMLSRALLPRMPERLGRIIFVSSRAAQGRAGRGYYAASKAALNGLARSLAAEQVARGITVNVVAPAATDTPQLRDPTRANAPVRPLPIGRLIKPEEVAATIAFLASVDAGAITGQTIYQCGGASLAGIDG